MASDNLTSERPMFNNGGAGFSISPSRNETDPVGVFVSTSLVHFRRTIGETRLWGRGEDPPPENVAKYLANIRYSPDRAVD